MSDAQNRRTTPATAKTPQSRIATDGQHACISSTYGSSSNFSPSVDSASSADACRKKSGFLITRIDKASISSALENESDMENEYANDRGGAGCRSPGSSSVISEGSSIFDDGVSPMEKSTIPRITLHHDTSSSSSIASPQVVQKSTALPPSIVKPIPTPLTIPPEPQTVSNARVAATVAAPVVQSPPAAKSGKDMPSSASSSRFHIIKIDAGPYKRGRWTCRDFDEACTVAPPFAIRSDLIALGGTRSGSSNCSSGRTSLHYVSEESGRQGTDGQQTPLALLTAATSNAAEQHIQQLQHQDVIFTASMDARNRAASPAPSVSTTASSTLQQHPSVVHSIVAPTSVPSTVHHQQQNSSVAPVSMSAQLVQRPSANRIVPPSGVDLNNAAAAILDSIIVGSIHRQNDQLLTSASSRENGDASLGAGQTTDSATGTMVQNAGLSSAGASVVAIDNKIEQAMDLVKTHLLYAVREEVEVLKEKIIDLEKKVFRLETENKLLREYAPPEILQQIQQQGTVSQTTPSLLNPAQQQQQLHSSASSQQQQQQQQQGVAESTSATVHVSPAVPHQSEPAKPGVSANMATGATTNTNGSPSAQKQQHPPTSS